MLVRYTRQLATAALIVAAGLGMGACSAHPGAAVVTSSGVTFSNADIHQAAQQLSFLTGGQRMYSDGQIRAAIMNEDAYLAGGAVVGVTVSDEVMNRLNQEAAKVQNLEPIELTPATRAALTSLLIDYQLTGVMQMNPTVAAQVNQAMNEASSSSTATLNPRFPVSSVKSEPTLFGDAVSGEKEPDVSSLMGGGTPGTTTR